MGERRDKFEPTRFDLETGEATEEGTWPDRCGWFYQAEKERATGAIAEIVGEATEVGIGDDLTCTFHAAQALGTTEDHLARLGLVRDEFFDVYSVEELANKNLAVHRDPVSCQQPWVGRCLWPMGYLVLWAGSLEEVDELLAGGEIEGAIGGAAPLQVWKP